MNSSYNSKHKAYDNMYEVSIIKIRSLCDFFRIGRDPRMPSDDSSKYILVSDLGKDLTEEDLEIMNLYEELSDTTPPDFYGVLDGCNHTIYNLKIKAKKNFDFALFRKIGGGGVIKNLRFSNIYIESVDSNASILALENRGKIENCTVSKSIVIGSRLVAPLVTFNRSYVLRCRSKWCTVSSSDFCSGGLVAYNVIGGHVHNCSSYDCDVGAYKIAGGLVGVNSGEIAKCTTSNRMKCIRNYSGGIVGLNATSHPTGVSHCKSISICYGSGALLKQIGVMYPNLALFFLWWYNNIVLPNSMKKHSIRSAGREPLITKMVKKVLKFLKDKLAKSETVNNKSIVKK